MRDELFNELVDSIREAGAYLRGEDVRVWMTCADEADSGAAAVEARQIDTDAASSPNV